jgi:uncharacterized membrane protein
MALFTALPQLDADRIVAAIQAAEQRTSGEIRVVVARASTPDPKQAARHEFARLGMATTRFRNGVLIFIAPRSRNFAVIGDTGVHEKCGDAFWQELANTMTEHFRRGEFTAGVVQAIDRAGARLAEHFPRTGSDRNELPDEIEET